MVTTISGQKRSFQWATTEKIAKAVIAGQAFGTMTRATMPASDMPSSLAAWIRSSGMARKNCRNRKIAKTEIENGATSAA
ncbi:hypothetical protein D9M70_650790 [compost metagenome]